MLNYQRVLFLFYRLFASLDHIPNLSVQISGISSKIHSSKIFHGTLIEIQDIQGETILDVAVLPLTLLTLPSWLCYATVISWRKDTHIGAWSIHSNGDAIGYSWDYETWDILESRTIKSKNGLPF
jgi:hypothetical protein